MKRVALSLSLVLAASLSVAHARPRKLSTAYAISGVGTGVSVALVLGAFALPSHSGDINEPLLWTGLGTSIFTPSLGNFYAEQYFTIGMAVRLGAAGMMAYVAATQRQDVACNTLMPMTCRETTNTGITLIGLAGLIYIGGAAADFHALPDAMDRYNERHRFQWAPTLTPSPTGSGAMLGLGGRF